MGRILAFAGRQGPLLLFFGVLTGLLFPALAAGAKPWMGVGVLVFTLGAFLKVEGRALSSELGRPGRAAAVLAWTLAGVPLLAWLAVRALPVPDELALGVMLCMLGPPVGSAAAIAAMLGLNAALALAATLAICVLTPFYLPPLASLLAGAAVQIDPLAMLARIVAVIGSAALAAFLLRRFAGGFVARNPSVMTGVSVIGLLVVAIGAMHGVPQHMRGHERDAMQLVALAFAVNASFQAIGALVFLRLGAVDALTVGLISGNRSVTLVWVVVAPWLGGLPVVEAYLAASLFPIFMLPLVTRPLLARLCSTPPGSAPAIAAVLR